LKSDVKCLGGTTNLEIRALQGTLMILEYGEHKGQLTIPAFPADDPMHRRMTEASAMVMAFPDEVKNGIPSQIKISLIIVHAESRKQRVEQFLIPLLEEMAPDDWKTQIEIPEQAREREYPLGKTIQIAIVLGNPLTLTVKPDQGESASAN
jgi:hypothetical protein